MSNINFSNLPSDIWIYHILPYLSKDEKQILRLASKFINTLINKEQILLIDKMTLSNDPNEWNNLLFSLGLYMTPEVQEYFLNRLYKVQTLDDKFFILRFFSKYMRPKIQTKTILIIKDLFENQTTSLFKDKTKYRTINPSDLGLLLGSYWFPIAVM